MRAASDRHLLVLAVVVVGACATSKPSAPPPVAFPPASITGPAIEPPALSTEHGMASYYGNSFAGRPTASGEPYRPSALTAAHRTLPLGAVVRVTRVDRDGRPVAEPIIVRINDRGPYARGRVIDLSTAAARRLHMIGDGVARVKLEVLELPPPRRGRGR
jgi:rare lipoprotein A